MFITEVLLGKGLSAKIIPEAIMKYCVDKVPVEETIKGCTDIRKFLSLIHIQMFIRDSLYRSSNES